MTDPAKEVDDVSQTIWGVVRGLGWTLDSERAIKMIRQQVQRAVNDCQSTIAAQEAYIEALRKDIAKLKQHIVSVDRGDFNEGRSE